MTGIEIKQIREKLKMTQRQLANKLGISLSTLRYWEYGRTNPSKMAMEKILRFLEERKWLNPPHPLER